MFFKANELRGLAKACTASSLVCRSSTSSSRLVMALISFPQSKYIASNDESLLVGYSKPIICCSERCCEQTWCTCGPILNNLPAEPLYDAGPNFAVASPIDEFLRAPMWADIGSPSGGSSFPKRPDDQKRIIIQQLARVSRRRGPLSGRRSGSGDG